MRGPQSKLRPTFAALTTLAALLALFPGCLSLGLGTKTTYVQESDDTLGRISSLEARVSELEQNIRRFDSAPVAVPMPVEQIELP